MLGLHPGNFGLVLNGCPLRDVGTVFFFSEEESGMMGTFFGFTPWKINTLNLKMEVDG